MALTVAEGEMLSVIVEGILYGMFKLDTRGHGCPGNEELTELRRVLSFHVRSDYLGSRATETVGRLALDYSRRSNLALCAQHYRRTPPTLCELEDPDIGYYSASA